MKILLMLCAVSVAVVGHSGGGHEFSRVYENRFAFDNEYQLPAETYLPVAHYSAEVRSLPAAMQFKEDGRIVMEFVAPTNVAPPYVMHLYLTGKNRPGVFVTKDGLTTLACLAGFPEGFEPREAALTRRLKFAVTKGMQNPKVSLTAGIGQADTRFVTTGRSNRPYMKDGRLYFTFSSRGYGSTLGVMSFDPNKFDLRMEGTIVFDYGDGLLRNDVACDLFYDDVIGEWRAYVSNFSTGSDTLGKRAEGGLNCAWSKECPLHGLSIMKAKSLGLKGMNEDPDGYYDEATGRWRLLVSEFVPGKISASIYESERWDGGFRKIAGPVGVDSTGTTIANMHGEVKCLFGSADRQLYIYSYPDLKQEGQFKLNDPPWNSKTSMNGRVWPAYIELADGSELMLTFDRVNFPGMPMPNWTYGKLIIYRLGLK